MTEISDFGTIIFVVTAGFVVAALSTSLTERVPVPAPAIFLVAAAAVSDIWPQIYDAVPIETVERIAVVALIVILFNGGMDIGRRRFRASAASILSIGLLGTFATAGIVTLVAHYALGFDWILAGIIGAAVAPTDPAVMFSVLGRREVGGRSGTILEGEAGVNDPAGIALMLGMIELATHDDARFLVVVREFVVEMSVGVVCGALGAIVLIPLLRRVRLPTEGLYPVLALVLAGALYGATSLAHGSGFLAVFVTGIAFGDVRTPYKGAIERFSGSLASLAELAVFVALGLTIDLGGLSGEIWLDGIVLLLVLALFARPLVVLLTLGLARLSWTERGFIAWSGLKGAVPILLAAFAVLGSISGADKVYGLVFVVVLLSVAAQGTLVPSVARALAIPMHEQPAMPWELSVRLGQEPPAAHEFEVAATSRVAGRAIRELPLGEHTWITLVVRDGAATRPGGSLQLEAGDRVLLLADPGELEALARLFEGSGLAGGKGGG
jgi:cell volume regulation protein A